jgi:chitinase
MGYYPEWGIYNGYTVDKIPPTLTHVCYAFMVPNPSTTDFNILRSRSQYPIAPYDPAIPEGTIVPYDGNAWSQNRIALRALKQRYPHIKVIISVGGWTLSWHLSKVFRNPTSRGRFVSSVTALLLANNFDGVDIDWEYVGSQGIDYSAFDPVQDPISYTSLMKELRQAFDASGRSLEIHNAVPASPSKLRYYTGSVHATTTALMTYDFAGGWSTRTAHQSNFYGGELSAQLAIQTALSMGLRADQLCIGVPLYGVGWSGATAINRPFTSYLGQRAINVLRPQLSTTGYDDVAKASFGARANEWWSFDSEVAASYKASQVKQQGLKCIIAWELSNDDPTYRILRELNRTLT